MSVLRPAITVCAVTLGFVTLGFVAVPAAHAVDIDSLWIAGGDGSWNLAGNWSPVGIPNNGGGNTYSVTIGAGVLVTIDTSVTVSNLDLGLTDHLRIINGRSLTLAGGRGAGSIDNAGLLEINSIGSATNLWLTDGLVTLAGGGTVRLTGGNAWLRRVGAEGALLNVDNIIEGGGRLSWSGSPTAITNQHLIRANISAPLEIYPGSELFVNEGTLRAESGSILRLQAGDYANTDGLIEAASGGIVELDGNATVSGGLLRSSDTGEVRASTGTPRLENVDFDGTLRILNARTLLASGTLVNAGTIFVDTVGSSTYLRPVDGTLTLTGGGTVRLMGANAWIYRDTKDGALVNVDNVIEGGGNIGWTGAPTPITNHGLIRALTGAPLIIQPSSALFTNGGTLRAQDGGTLRLNGGTYDNAGGIIEALDGSTVELNGDAVIIGGTLAAEGSGEFAVTISTPRLVDVVIDAPVRITNARTLLGTGTIENLGEIVVDTGGSSTYFGPFGGELALTGGGTVRLGGASAWIYRQDADSSILNVDNIIEGGGNLGWAGAPTAIRNQGLVRANSAVPLVIRPGASTFTNEATLSAVSGSTLVLDPGTFDNSTGVILAEDGAAVHLNGTAHVLGGTLTSNGSGEFVVTIAGARIDDALVDAFVRVTNARTLLASGTIDNRQEIFVESGGSATSFRSVDGELLLVGGGTVRLSSAGASLFRQGVGDSLRNIDNTIRGAGSIGTAGAPTDFINEGVVRADAPGVLTISPGATIGFVNDGTLLADNGDVVISGSNAIDQRGIVEIAPTRSLSRTGASYRQTDGTTTVRGTLSVSGGGNVVRLEGGTLLGDGLVTGPIQNVGGTVAPGLSIGTLSQTGLFTQSGSGTLEVEIDGPRSNDLLAITGNAQLGGVLRPLFDSEFVPTVGDEWTVLTATAVTGSFASVAGCERFKVIYQSNQVRIEYTGVLKLGDLNCDGAVDGADLGLMLTGWGTCPTSGACAADLNGDGVVNGADLGLLLTNWG